MPEDNVSRDNMSEEKSHEEEIDLGNNQPEAPERLLNQERPKSDSADSADTAESLVDELIHMQEDEFIPWEEVTLPSKGEYYGETLPGGVVRVRAMGIHADKILATQRLAQTGQSIDYLFKHCVQLTEGFDPLDLLTGDRIFLLYVLRGITHGNTYEFALKCPQCEYMSSHIYDLNELAETVKNPDPSIGSEPFKVHLPYMSKAMGKDVWVKVRFMRGRDINQLSNRQRFNKRVRAGSTTNRKERQVVIDETVTDNLATVIASIGGDGLQGEVNNSMKIKAVVDRMHAKDTATIREFLRENSPGIDTTIQVECPECGYNIRTELPITENFFRPTSDRPSGRT